MEAEARRRGLNLIRGGEPELLELHLDDDFGWDDGLICGGTASIFIQPMGAAAAAPYQAALELNAARGRGVFALLAAADDPALAGQACLFREGAPAVGSIGHPAVQDELAEAARGFLREGREAPRRVRLQALDAVAYLEPLAPRPVLFIAGAGHIGAAVCHYGARLGFEVVVVDDRPSLANAERLPDADRVLAEDIVAAVRAWPKTPDTYFVIVTRGHRNDAVVLREVIHAPVAYIGMIGSRRKILTIFQEFIAQGIATAAEMARVRAPIGLDIGAITVDEIAVSIAAELVSVRREGAAHGDRDCPGGGGVPADGTAEAAAAARVDDRARRGRHLAQSLPGQRDPGGHRPPGGGDRGSGSTDG
jgi:xanthine dehydrogenase accessory factor